MSIVTIIGVVLALIILVTLVKLIIWAAAKFNTPLGDWAYALWCVAVILAIFLVAYAFNIPIPFFTWR